jgi:kinetochore protein Mis13/DSN1
VLICSLALPHSEVEITDFYKHIESEGLPEPRRMRQLLTWCATRAMSEHSGASPHTHPEYDDQSARLAGEHGSAFFECSLLTASTARVIQEELLKDFANRSEMSDWFGREDMQKPEVPLPVRPNPKNEQNATKIAELEAQIRR